MISVNPAIFDALLSVPTFDHAVFLYNGTLVISKLVRFSIFGLVILSEFDEAFLEFIISRDFYPAARCSDSKHDLSECILTFVWKK